MHLMQKCILASNAFWRTFSKGKCSAYIFQRKMFSKTKCYKCIFAYILLCKMFSITFSFGKCSAVQKCCVFCFAKNKDALQKYIFASHFVGAKMLCFLLCKKQRCVHFVLRCKNAFLHQMHFCINKMLQMHLMQKCIFATRTFSKGKCSAKQNVTNAFDALRCQNAFCRFLTFCKQNVRAASNAFCRFLTFCKQNVRKRQNAFWRTFSKGKCSAVQKCI